MEEFVIRNQVIITIAACLYMRFTTSAKCLFHGHHWQPSSPGTPKRLLIGPCCRLGRVAHVMIVAMIVLSSAPWGHRTFARQSLMCLTSLTREHIHLTMGDYIVPSPSLVVPMSQSLRIRSASFIPTKKRHISRLKYHTLAAETQAKF